jgi:hypothetical protein
MVQDTQFPIHRSNVLVQRVAEKVWSLCEQRVYSPVVGKEAGHVHQDGNRRDDGLEGEVGGGGAEGRVAAVRLKKDEMAHTSIKWRRVDP